MKIPHIGFIIVLMRDYFKSIKYTMCTAKLTYTSSTLIEVTRSMRRRDSPDME